MTGSAARAEGPQRLGVQADGTAACAIGITKTYGREAAAVTALDQVSVAFGRGRFTAVMGPSGSGKSTLLHCLAGLDTVDSGTIRIGDTDLTTLDERRLTRLRRDHVGFVFQSYNLLPTLTAEENILLPLAIAGRKPDRAWIDQVVDAVGLRARLRHRPGELSGGEQQRVAAARALASRPTVVFADEPTGNLDSRASTELLEFLRRSVDELEQTIVMVTHDPVAAGHADEALFLADGCVVDAISCPTAARVLDRIKALGSSGGGAAAELRGPSSAEGG
jgi:putative ABC transport system ATP-binding protein